MCLVLGVIGDQEVGVATERALEGLLPVRLIEAAAELPGAVSAQRPLVVVASHRDPFGDPVVPRVAEVRRRLPHIGFVLISDIGAPVSERGWDLSLLGEIRSVKARSHDYRTNLRRAADVQAERYRAEYIARAFAPHTPPNLRPLLRLCVQRWGKRLRANDVAAALKRDRHTLLKRVQAAQPACSLYDVLVGHHVLDVAWELCARQRPLKLLARRFGYWPASRLNANVRSWIGIDLKELALTGVQGWEGLVDHLLLEFIGDARAGPSRGPHWLQH